ncbi:MAG TPA: hypothetical protein DD435_05435, partial [Cyanobacteria bacterium UBA8530]|nr:hypothetical protein [Cyanobacteria bacterium UBA8530]
MDLKNLGLYLPKIIESFSPSIAAPRKAATTQPLDPKVFMPRDTTKLQEVALEKLERCAASRDSDLDDVQNTNGFQKNDLIDAIAKETAEVTADKKALKTLEKSIAGKTGDLNKAKGTLANLVQQREGLAAKLAENQNHQWQLGSEKSTLMQAVFDSKKKIKQNSTTVDLLKNENVVLKKQEQQVVAARSKVENFLGSNQNNYLRLKKLPPNQLTNTNKAFMMEFEGKTKEFVDLGHKISLLNAKQTADVRKISVLVAENNGLNKTINKNNVKIAENDKKLAKLARESGDLNKQLKGTHTRIAYAEKLVGNLSGELGSLAKQSGSLKVELKEHEAKLAALALEKSKVNSNPGKAETGKNPLTAKAFQYFDGLYRGAEIKQSFLKLPPEKQAKFCSDFEASLDPKPDPSVVASLYERAVQRVSMCFNLLAPEPPKLSAPEAAVFDYIEGFGFGEEEAIKQRFLLLPKEQREQLCNVLANLDHTPKEVLTSVLANEKVWEMKGNAEPKIFGVLANLDRIAKGELCPELKQLGLDKKAMMATLIDQICREGSVFQGKDTDTCSAASLQANLANTDPAEYTRIAAGLMLDGKVKINGDKSLDLSTSETGKEDGGRSDFDDVMQGTFVTFGRKFEAAGDDYFSGRGGAGGSFRGEQGQGLTANQILNMN